jgi:methionyl aminopeptidase
MPKEEMEKDVRDKYVKAGKILQAAKKKAQQLIKPGASLLEVAEQIEKFIESDGGKPAFPINLSLNNCAAHYTPSANDKSVFSEKDVVKADIGVHIDGYAADSAVTIDLSGEFGKMLDASEKALEVALSVAKPGIETGKIGTEIEAVIKKAGFRPIQNLTGHRIDRWEVHSAPSIPNVASKDNRKLEPGNVYAIEPFVTDGEGRVRDGVQAEIFGFDVSIAMRNLEARKMIKHIEEKYHSLPFAERWLARELKQGEFARKVALRELLKMRAIHAYPMLVEKSGAQVCQAESCFIVEEKGITVLA